MHSHGFATRTHTHAHAGGTGEHTHTGEIYSARPHPEPVVLDIGGDVGALIIHTDAEMHGIEVEISVTGQDEARTHKEVLEREINGRPAYTAVFDVLSEGTYTLWVHGAAVAREVAIAGASVAELDWSAGVPLAWQAA
jgi:hypothetical protein